MFVLKVINSKNVEYEILKNRSQLELDKFTTFYKDENQLLEELSFEKGSKVLVVQTISKDKEPVILPFTNETLHNVVHDFQNEEYFDKIVNYDKEVIKKYFQNELLKYDYNNRSKFEKDKYIYCKEILKDLGRYTESDNKELLKKDLMSFFEKYYSGFKDFYKYIINFYEDRPFLKSDEIDEFEKLYKSIVEKLEIDKNKDEKVLPIVDEIDSIRTNVFADDDDVATELDIFLDDQGIDEETKHDIMQKQIKKL